MPKSTPTLRFPHPGEILREEFLEPMGISQYRLALDLRIPHSRVAAMSRIARSHCRFQRVACFTSMQTTCGRAPGWRLRVSTTKSISAPPPVW